MHFLICEKLISGIQLLKFESIKALFNAVFKKKRQKRQKCDKIA